MWLALADAMAAGLRERFASVLDRSGALDATRRWHPHRVAVFTFHRVEEPAADDPLDPDVIDATPAEFRRHVERLARVGTPITSERLVAALDGAPLPPRSFLITFDDGYRSCRDVACPILCELGVPATFFIATGFVDTGRLYWWDRVSAILQRARRPGAELRRHLDNIIKNTRGLDVERFLVELASALDVPWTAEIEASLARSVTMGWDDIRDLARAGMDVQSHTRMHRVLETLDAASLRDELVGSRRDLEARLGRNVCTLAYPVGRRPSAHVRRAVAEAGYRLAFTNATGVNWCWPGWASTANAFEIRRLAMERGLPGSYLAAQLAVPMLARTI